MSVDRDPVVGDVFKWHVGSTPHATVLAVLVADDAVLYRWNDGDYVGGDTVVNWRQDAVLVPPRPKVRDQWGVLQAGDFSYAPSEASARQSAERFNRLLVLARIVNGVVCDEHGEPLEVE